MIKIVQKNSTILRTKATPVKVGEIRSSKIRKIIVDMKKALDSQEDGVAIAAPQISVPLRIFVVSRRVFDILKDTKSDPSSKKNEYKDLVFINPEIVRFSKEREFVEEGCLSVRWLYGKVHRAKKAKIVAYNEHGIKFELGASGLLAQIFQHECDHLNGILFIDTAKDVENIPPDVQKTRSVNK